MTHLSIPVRRPVGGTWTAVGIAHATLLTVAEPRLSETWPAVPHSSTLNRAAGHTATGEVARSFSLVGVALLVGNGLGAMGEALCVGQLAAGLTMKSESADRSLLRRRREGSWTATEFPGNCREVALLSEQAFKATMGQPMRPVEESTPLPPDFWRYFDGIPPEDFRGYEFGRGEVRLAYREPAGQFDHVLLGSSDPDVFMVVVVDRVGQSVYGHHLLDLPKAYGLR